MWGYIPFKIEFNAVTVYPTLIILVPLLLPPAMHHPSPVVYWGYTPVYAVYKLRLKLSQISRIYACITRPAYIHTL